jgi:16S rRNA (uracil1498-N3)-methyltransferase
MQLFYNPTISSNNNFLTFDKEESKHIVKVLRKDIGDILMVTNGNGGLFSTKITEATEKKCVVSIINSQVFQRPNHQLHLAISPTKMNERIEWFLEKSTEIGISEITFVLCNRSERNAINMERFEKIIVAAAKQSMQYFFPKINALIKLETFVKQENTTQKFIAHCEQDDKKHLKELLKIGEKTLILIGPEGDFTNSEIEMAIENNFQPISLGEKRLRTETAGVMSCAIFEILNS